MKKKNTVIFIILIVALGLGGFLLTKEGKDAVSVAMYKKQAILTADQVSVSFQQVGGRVTDVLVQEGQFVKQDEVLMVLDPTDTELQIARLTSEIAAMNAKIKQAEEAIGGEEVARQKLMVDASREILENNRLNYERTKELYESGAMPKVNFEAAELQLTLAENKLQQEQEQLSKIKRDITNKVTGIDPLVKQREGLNIQLKSLNVQKERLILKAPSDGKIVRLTPKVGENVAPGAPVIVLETGRSYFDLYVPETQVAKFEVGKLVPVHIISLNKTVDGEIRFITRTPQFANLRMSREKGQADLNSFQIRVYIEDSQKTLPGMTVEVDTDEMVLFLAYSPTPLLLA